jgi:hypothetical protein
VCSWFSPYGDLVMTPVLVGGSLFIFLRHKDLTACFHLLYVAVEWLLLSFGMHAFSRSLLDKIYKKILCIALMQRPGLCFSFGKKYTVLLSLRCLRSSYVGRPLDMSLIFVQSVGGNKNIHRELGSRNQGRLIHSTWSPPPQ